MRMQAHIDVLNCPLPFFETKLRFSGIFLALKKSFLLVPSDIWLHQKQELKIAKNLFDFQGLKSQETNFHLIVQIDEERQ